MRITILKAIDRSRFIAMAGGSIVNAVAGPDLEQHPIPGDDAEAEASGGVFKIASSSAPAYLDEGAIAASRSGGMEGASVLESASAVKAGGEGASPEEAFEAMLDAASSINANAVLNARLECVIRKYPRTRVLFRYIGSPAIADGGKCHARPGIHLNVHAPSRTNSPNRAMARYLRVLLASGLFIALPIASRLCALHNMTRYSLPICLSLTLAALVLGFLVFPRGRRAFIIR